MSAARAAIRWKPQVQGGLCSLTLCSCILLIISIKVNLYYEQNKTT